MPRAEPRRWSIGEESLMQYIQLVEFDTSHPPDEVRRAMDAWLDASRGRRSLQMAVVATDHDRPNHFWELLEFSSEGEAAEVAGLPETKVAYDHWARLLDGEPVFHNLDVVEQVGGPEGIPSVGLASWPTPGGG